MDILSLKEGFPRAVWNNYFRCDYAVWEVGKECEVHCHQDAAEVFVFLDGECEITVEGQTRVVGAGHTVYTGPGVKHKLKAVGSRPLVMFLLVAPNHSPTHTMYYADGRVENHDRTAPAPADNVIH